MKPSVEKTLTIGISLAIAIVIAIVFLSIRQFRRLRETGARIRETNEVLFNTETILAASINYQLKGEDFLLTGDSSFLDSLQGSASLVHIVVADLKRLTVANPSQQRRIDSLLYYVNRSMELLNKTVRLRQDNRIREAAALVASEEEKGYLAQVQSIVQRLQAEENRLLAIRRKANQDAALGLQQMLVAVIAAVTVLSFVIIKKIRIDFLKERSAKEQLNNFARELEEQVKAKTAGLQASEEKYRTIFYKSPLPKWVYDTETLRFKEVNDAAILNYGYTEEEFLKMTILDIRPKEDFGRLLDDLEGARSSPEDSRYGCWRHVKKNGEIIFVEVTAHPIEYDHRQARMVVVNDITEQKQAEAMLQRLNEDLQRRASELADSNAELERFAYIASHDLQEPLRMVSSFLQLLKKKYQGRLDEKADQYIHYAVDGAERMKVLILDLLEYSRMDTGKENFERVDLNKVAQEVIGLFEENLNATGAIIKSDHLPVVTGDKVQLVQLFQNLIGNALKYRSKEPPVIGITVREESGNWLFAVSDNGIGVDPQFFDKIFIIFQRLHTKTEYSGTGIGLAICKKIVERHGGNIWVKSELGAGSTFFFTIGFKPFLYEIRNSGSSHLTGG